MLKESNQLTALLLQCDTFEEELFQAQIDSGIDVDALLSQSVPQALAAAKARLCTIASRSRKPPPPTAPS